MGYKSLHMGLSRLLSDIRFHPERFRQFIGIIFIVLVCVAGKTSQVLFIAGTVLVILGIGVRLWASGHIFKNKVLATGGPYAYVRHPLYVGNTLLGVGYAIASGLWWSIPLFLLIMLVFYPRAIRLEDEKLHRTFKEEWEQWQSRTRALIPRLTPYPQAQSGGWSFRQSLRKNGEPMIALFLLLCLYFLSLSMKN